MTILVRNVGFAIQCISALALVVCLAIAISTYPGGTKAKPDLQGYSMTDTYLSDLMNPKARNGMENPIASVAAVTGLMLLVPGMFVLWLRIPTVATEKRSLLFLASTLGLISCFGATTAFLASASDHKILHTIGIFLGGVPGFAAMVISSLVMLSTKAYLRYVGYFGLVTATVGLSSVMGYAITIITVHDFPTFLPTSQNTTLIGIVLWMLSAGFLVRARYAE